MSPITTGGFPRSGKSPANAASVSRPWLENIPRLAPFLANHSLYKTALPAAMSTRQNPSQGEAPAKNPSHVSPQDRQLDEDMGDVLEPLRQADAEQVEVQAMRLT
jgi:hypothetical protein